MAKESLFNILANQLDFSDNKILDLFSGTGGISFEFASRGCCKIVSIEKNYIHYKHIAKTTEKLGLKNMVNPIKSDVFQYLKSCKESFDLIFADPPYDLERIAEIPETILNSQVIRQKGILILEHSGDFDFGETVGFTSLRRYGKVNFSFFKKY